MLLRLYSQWAEQSTLTSAVIDGFRHEPAGIERATLHITGDFAYGLLMGESGVHRLVRLNPSESGGRRFSFAGIDVIPEIADPDIFPLCLDDLQRAVFRTGGPGGRFL
jgi:peptide chain release factor 2